MELGHVKGYWMCLNVDKEEIGDNIPSKGVVLRADVKNISNR